MDGRINPKIQDQLWLKFTAWCHQAVVEGYRNMRRDSRDFKECEEEDISLALYLEMKKLPLLKAKQIWVVGEFRLYSEDIKTGKLKAKNADRIDFHFMQWKLNEEITYSGEAKNLSHKNWEKLIGTIVNASKYRVRYIETGIEKLLFGAYSVGHGFLIGYVVNGCATDNVAGVNMLLKKRQLPPKIGLIEMRKAIAGYDKCYLSINQRDDREVKLQHIFLEFDVVSS